MNSLDLIKSAASNLLRNKGRTLLTVIAIFIGAFTIALTSGVNQGVNDYIDRQVNSVGGEDQLIIYKATNVDSEEDEGPQKYEPEAAQGAGQSQIFEAMNQEDIDRISETTNIKSIQTIQTSQIDYIAGKNEEKYVFSSLPTIKNLHIELKAGKSLDQTTDEYQVALQDEFVKALGYKSAKDAIGQTVTLAVPNLATKEQTMLEATIVAIRDESLIQGGASLTNKALTDEIVRINEEGLPDSLTGQYSQVVAEMTADLSDKEVTKVKDALVDKGYMALTIEDQIGMIRGVINAITGVLTLFGAIALLAASFGIINTLYMSVQERTREIGLMKAMGLGAGKIFTLFSIEAALIGFLGSLLGILGAIGAGSIINQIAGDSFLKELPGKFSLVLFSVPSSLVIIVIIMAIAFLAGTLPARRAAKLDPIEALRYE